LAGDDDFNLTENLLYAASRGRSYFQQVKDLVRYAFGSYKISIRDYYYFALFDSEMYTDEVRGEFVSDDYFGVVVVKTCDREWWAISNDKVIAYTLLHGAGTPIPEPRGIYHPFRMCPGAKSLRSVEDVIAWLRDPETAYPMFGKPISGVQSKGQAMILGADLEADTLDLKGQEPMDITAFATMVVNIQGTSTHDGYLFQEVLKPHPDIVRMCGNRVSTVRVVVIIDEEGPKISHTTWKIGTGDNIADAFWREGNMVADIDPMTGEIKRIVRGSGIDLEIVTKHPDTREVLLGQNLPDWQAMREMILRSAALLPKVRFQGWDVSLCDRGPVVVEANTGSAFSLPQISSARGFMTPEFKRFVDRAAELTILESKAEM